MTVRPIVQLGDPVLRQISAPVEQGEVIGADIKQLITDLRDTLKSFQQTHCTGRGIAAPQIGVLKRVIYINYGSTDLTLINPEIKRQSDELFDVWDSCFSYWGVVFKVSRHKMIEVSYLNVSGEIQSVIAEGDLSELLQHELEHLDGRCAIDLLVPQGRIMTQRAFEARENFS